MIPIQNVISFTLSVIQVLGAKLALTFLRNMEACKVGAVTDNDQVNKFFISKYR